MAVINKVLGFENHDTYALVTVQLTDGTEATVYVGGRVEVYFNKGRISAFVMRSKGDAGHSPAQTEGGEML